MKANEDSMLKFMDGSDMKFIIPVYQRPYSWKKDNCEQLLNDLRDVYTYHYESHFFGSIVYVAQEDGDTEERIIIDGQQRLTTVSLILIAIRNYVLGKPKTKFRINPDKILNSYLIDEYSEDKRKLKLKLVQGDDQVYDELLNGKMAKLDSKVKENYDYFAREIRAMTEEQVEGLFDAIGKLMIVSIRLSIKNGDDPQLIFESLNSTGLELEASDKIRNFILIGMNAEQQEQFYRNYWKKLESIVNRDDMTTFIRQYLGIKTRKLPSEKTIYKAFKNYTIDCGLDVTDLIDDMIEYGGYYNKICHAKQGDFSDKIISIHIINIIDKLGVKTSVPFLMELLKAYTDRRLRKYDLKKSLQLVESFIVRRIIAELPTNVYSKLFILLGAEIEREIENYHCSYFEAFKFKICGITGRSRFPNNDEFQDKFLVYDIYNAKPAAKNFILERLENFQREQPISLKSMLDDKVVFIERVMPGEADKLIPEWKTMLGDNWAQIQTKYKDTIGNVTIANYVKSYTQASYKRKREVPVTGLQYSSFSLNDFLKDEPVWNERSIVHRAGVLYQKAVRMWPWMKVEEQKLIDKGIWLDWSDEINLSGRVVTRVKVLDIPIDVDNIAVAYRNINKILFDEFPNVYTEGNFPWFGRRQGDLDKWYQIGEAAYLNTDKTQEEELDQIREIAKKIGLRSSDIQFFVQWNVKGRKFDVKDPSTYALSTVGGLAYSFFDDLIKNHAITEQEMEELKTREYTKQKFKYALVPAVADRRDANSGGGPQLKYRKTPLNFNGKDVFIATAWHERDREALIKWYERHTPISDK